MNDAHSGDRKREEHRVPPWITGLWLTFVLILASSAIIIAVRLNCDPVRTLGFLAASSVLIFGLSAGAYFALYGMSILVEGIEYHKSYCEGGKHWASMGDFMR